MDDDGTKVWVMGKAEPGWYVARWEWNKAYADHLTSIGYEVRQSIEKPTN